MGTENPKEPEGLDMSGDFQFPANIGGRLVILFAIFTLALLIVLIGLRVDIVTNLPFVVVVVGAVSAVLAIIADSALNRMAGQKSGPS
jgi:hypothetical protein